MKRDQILNVVIKNIKLNVEGAEETEVDSNKSILEYGGSSLDILEIVSSSMRELQIIVPRTELANVKTIDDLVDLLYLKSQYKPIDLASTPSISKQENAFGDVSKEVYSQNEGQHLNPKEVEESDWIEGEL